MAEDKKIRESQAVALANLAREKCQFFKSPGGVVYAEIEFIVSQDDPDSPEKVRLQTFELKSTGFKEWLAAAYNHDTSKAATRDALSSAMQILAGENNYCRSQMEKCEVTVRFARTEGTLWIDLADELGNAIKITKEGWEIVSGPKLGVKFIRPVGMLALPIPERLNQPDNLQTLLSPFLNLQNRGHFQLLLTWLCFCGCRGDKPILVIVGPAGSAKSTTVRLIRTTLDPNEAELCRLPKDDHIAAISAEKSGIIAYDNISKVGRDMADTLCCIATGQGVKYRVLYTDSDEKIFKGIRPQIMNGITDPTYRADFLDRAIDIELREIPVNKRRSRSNIDRMFAEAHPSILRAILDVLTASLQPLTSIQKKQLTGSLPRMTDFAVFGVKVERALGFGEGTFMAAYRENINQINQMVVEGNDVARYLIRFLKERAGNSKKTWPFIVTYEQLLQALNRERDADSRDSRESNASWPKNTLALSSRLRTVSGAITREGFRTSFSRNETDRLVTFSRVETELRR